MTRRWFGSPSALWTARPVTPKFALNVVNPVMGPTPRVVVRHSAAHSVADGASRRRPAPAHGRDHARRRPATFVQAPQRVSPTPARVRPRPVVRRRKTAVETEPVAHRLDHALAGPAPLDRAGMARLAVGVGVALAVARLGIRATPTTDADVAGLHGSRLLPGRVVEVRLDRRWRATEPSGDLGDRESLSLPKMPGQRHRSPALGHSIGSSV